MQVAAIQTTPAVDPKDDAVWLPIRSACAANDTYALDGAPLSTSDGVRIAGGVWRPGGQVEVQLGRDPGTARATLVRP